MSESSSQRNDYMDFRDSFLVMRQELSGCKMNKIDLWLFDLNGFFSLSQAKNKSISLKDTFDSSFKFTLKDLLLLLQSLNIYPVLVKSPFN